MTDTSKALILFSGGQDSATCLAWALERFETVETVGFDYGQRHAVELDCRPRLIAALRENFPRWSGRLGEDHVLDLKVLGAISDTALTSDRAIAFAEGGLPNTYVPGRNLLFLTLAAALGARRGIGALVSAGRAGLQQHSARFAPVAHRGGLMLSIVLALADTQALLLYGMVEIEDHSTRLFVHAGPFFASAGVMMIALWGLWNMRMWGMLLNIVANVIIAGLAISGVFDLPGILAAGLFATAVVQLLIPIPMIRAMLQRSRRIEA